MDEIQFAKYTSKIKSMLPFWFKMKKQPHDSMGLQFLNVMGLQLDDIDKILTYAYNQVNLETIDIDFVDIIYKALIPDDKPVDTVKDIKVNSTSITETNDLYLFFGLDKTYNINNNINHNDYYFFDRDRKIIYVREPYDKDNTFTNGKIYVEFNNDEVLEIPLSLHHVWNFLDEFGALFGCTRLYGENNYNYKKRLLDVFINPANSSKIGLANGISRELGLRKYKTWENPKKEFIIKDEMVIINTITKNGEYIDLEKMYINADGHIVLKPDLFETERNLSISYIAGIEINSLANSKSNKFSNELYNANGTPTDLLIEYIDEIKNNSSILWNDFYYDETMWVQDDSEFEIGHYSFVPSTFDSSIKGFAKYGFSKTNRQ